MAETAYTTVHKGGEGYYEEKKSRFLGFTYHVETEEETEQILADARRRYRDARHVCYGYVIDGTRLRFSDDGEPAGTAGRQILELLQKEELTKTLAIVVRYFGGTLLGTAGLTRAYTQSTADALANSSLIHMRSGRQMSVTADYNSYGKLVRFCEGRGIIIDDTEFSHNVKITLCLTDEDAKALSAAATEISCGSALIDAGDPLFFGRSSSGELIVTSI